MTPDQLERLAVLETKTTAMEETVRGMDMKLDELIAAKNMGQGVLWLFFKAAALFAAVVAGATWIANHVRL